MKDSLEITNHGVTLGFSRGSNIGVIMTAGKKIMNAQIEYNQVEELIGFLDRSSIERERMKNVINATSDRNEFLRGLLKELHDEVNEMLEIYDAMRNIESSRFGQLRKLNQEIKKELEI